MKINNKKDFKSLLLLLCIIVIAIILRVLWLKHNLFFGWEQGRDFLKLQEIVSGDLTLVGPKTDIDGVFHGAFSYYILLIPFVIFGGDPYLVLFSLILVNSLSIIFLYKSVLNLFSKRIAYISTFLYALSYSSIIYSRWLSNPNLVPALTIFFVYFLIKSKKNSIYLLISFIVWGIIFHLIVVVAISLILPSLIFIFKEKIRWSVMHIVCILILFLILFSSYFAFEVKNNFIMLDSLINEISRSGSLATSGLEFVDQFINEIVDNIFPTIPRVALIAFLFSVFIAIKSWKKYEYMYVVFTFLFSVPLLFILLSNAPLRHFFITVPIFLSILLAIVIDRLLFDKRVLAYSLLFLAVLGNLYTYFIRIPVSQADFIHHAQRTYFGDMKNIVDYIYNDAAGKKFTYDYYSVPYWKEDAWIYLFKWYGKDRYGFAPNSDRTNVQRSEIFYTIIEPNETVPVHLDNWYGEYKKELKLIEVYESGKLKVEKRIVQKNEN